MKKICHVVQDVDTDYKLEQFLAENDFILETEEVSDAAFELLNFAEIGREHQEPEGGMFTSFGYVEQHSDLVEAYKTLDLTAKMPDHTIILELPFTFRGRRKFRVNDKLRQYEKDRLSQEWKKQPIQDRSRKK